MALRIKDEIEIRIYEDGFIRMLDKYRKTEEHVMMVISKSQAIVLLMFDGISNVEGIVSAIQVLFDIDEENARVIVDRTLDLFASVFTDDSVDVSEKNNKQIKTIIKTVSAKPTSQLPMVVERLSFPSELIIFITDDCACNCIYCRVGAGISSKEKAYMRLEDFEIIANQCNEIGISKVEFTGGDPLCHPSFVEILSIFTERNIEVSLSTKKPLTNEEIEELKQRGLKQIQISIDTLNPETFSELLQVSEKQLIALTDTIEALIQYKMLDIIKTVVTSKNVHQIPDLVGKLSEMGANRFVLQNFSRGDRYDASLFPTFDDYVRLEDELGKILYRMPGTDVQFTYTLSQLQAGFLMRKFMRPDCMAGVNGLVIQTTGEYAYCGQSSDPAIRFGHIRNMTLKEAWDSKELNELLFPQRFLFDGTLCHNCAELEICNRKRCYVASLKFKNKLYDVDPRCMYSGVDWF